MDIDPPANPIRVVTEPDAPEVTIPEVIVPKVTVLEEDTPPEPDHPAAGSSSAPPIPPEASVEKVIEKNPVAPAAAPEKELASSIPISIDVPVEDAIVGGLKESLAKASQFELRLRDLASDAELLKTTMHVSTFVSSSPTGCPNDYLSELYLFPLILSFQ